MKKILSISLLVLTLLMVLPTLVIGASASSAYQTYTYSIEGTALYSPDAYSAEISLTTKAMQLDKDLNQPSDLVTDAQGYVYIADKGNNRIVILNRHYEYEESLEGFSFQGIYSAFSGPEGVFVTDTSIWICDTGNARLIEFDRETRTFKKKVDAPKSQLLGEGATFRPVAMAVRRILHCR